MPIPPPGQPIQGPDYSDAYAGMGLGGLAQGFTQGLQIGHGWGQQADELQAKREQIANEAAWRESQAKETAKYHADETRHRDDMVKFMKDQAGKIGTPVLDSNGNVVGYETGKGGIYGPKGKGAGKDSESLDSMAGAYKALDNYTDLARGFAPSSSALAASAQAPFSYVRSLVDQTSPANNLADKSGEVATLIATAVNKAGGGRMSEAEVANMKRAIGGNGIGETVNNILKKHEGLKDELALKSGHSRQEIERYLSEHGNRKVDPAARFQELINSGKSEAEAYQMLAAEGH